MYRLVSRDCHHNFGLQIVRMAIAGRLGARRFVAVFGSAFLIYLAFFGGHYVSGDNSQRIAWAKALIDCHCNDISPYFPGLHHTKYGIGVSLLQVPFIVVARLFAHITGIPIEGPLNMMLFTLNSAIGVAFVYLILERQGVQWCTAAMGALVIGVTTVWFPYSKVEYAEAIVTTLILAMYLLVDGHPWVAGLIGGFVVAIRQDALVIVALTGTIAPSNRKSFMPIAIGMIPGLLLTIAANHARTGSILSSGYEVDFRTPILTGLYGFLFSAGKSLFLFSPLMVLYFAAARRLWSDPAQRRLIVWSLALLGVQLLLYAKWWDWSGDDAWGPRFIVTATIVCLIVVAASDYMHSRWFAMLAVLGALMQIPPVLIGPHSSLMLVHLRKPMKTDTGTIDRSPITLDDMRFDPSYSQITATCELLLFKASGGRLEASSSFLSSFDPPLRPEDVLIDVLWLHPNATRRTR